MPYPTSSDLLAFLTESGITVPGSMDLEAYAAEAVAQWETATGYRPFLADSTESTRTYDPPGPNRRGQMRGGGTLLFLNTGFVQITEVFQEGLPLEEEIDYRTLPYNAAASGGPVTALEFTSPMWGKPGGLAVKGRVGYCDALAPDVWGAIRKLAASLVLDAMEVGAGNAVLVQSGDDKIRYDTARQWGVAWRREARLAMAAKRLIA